MKRVYFILCDSRFELFSRSVFVIKIQNITLDKDNLNKALKIKRKI